MSGGFQVLMVIARLLDASEPSPVKAVEGLADPTQTRDWRSVGSLLLKACLLLVVEPSKLRGFRASGILVFLVTSDGMLMDVA